MHPPAQSRGIVSFLWGIPRDATDWSSEYAGELFAGRGFTGHEHLTEFSLINMNGRIYDPILGRFLSPDPHVQMPDYPNNYNRYSYALNNPLIYTDPDGEFIWFVLGGAILGSYIGGSVAAGDGGLKGGNCNPFGGKNGSWKGADW